MRTMVEILRIIIRRIIVVLLAFGLILLAHILTRSQSIHQSHTDRVEAEDSMRFVSVDFMSKDSNLIYWKRETKDLLVLSSFAYGKETVVDGKLEGYLCIVYCKQHLFAYLITPCKLKGR